MIKHYLKQPKYSGITILSAMLLASLLVLTIISKAQGFSKWWQIGIIAIIYFIVTLYLVGKDEKQWFELFRKEESKEINEHNKKISKNKNNITVEQVIYKEKKNERKNN